MRATAVAHANIALAKYWGKLPGDRNLPAVPSLSLTLDALKTTTEVEFAPDLAEDVVELDGSSVSGRARDRVTELLDRVRQLAGSSQRARVRSRNDFPTAAGLASSASGFAALALAASHAAGLSLDGRAISALARASSASAARSAFGGFATLLAGAESAEPLAPVEHWPLVMFVALTARGPKAMGSSAGMRHTAATSPYYRAWCEAAPAMFEEVRQGVLERSWHRLGPAMEQSALAMHASMIAAGPGLIYWVPASLSVMAAVQQLRAGGVPAYFTMDAGPHVKVLTDERSAPEVRRTLAAAAGVEGLIESRPGTEAHLLDPREP